jgi:L-fuconolactonase
MQRRDALRLAAFSAGAIALRGRIGAAPAAGPIIDAHIHLFDPTRSGGVPWPEKSDVALYEPALPVRYAGLSAPFGVVGAIAIEASPLASDNQWLLDIAAGHPLIVGVIGDLIPGSPPFMRELDRLHANPLFLGIRYGNLWDRDLSVDLDKPGFVDGLKALAQAGLVLDSANPDPAYYRAPLDAIWDTFGEDHILFGSDWPNSDHVAPYADTLSIVHQYISRKPPSAQEKYFWKNSIAAYKWHKRRPDQPAL